MERGEREEEVVQTLEIRYPVTSDILFKMELIKAELPFWSLKSISQRYLTKISIIWREGEREGERRVEFHEGRKEKKGPSRCLACSLYSQSLPTPSPVVSKLWSRVNQSSLPLHSTPGQLWSTKILQIWDTVLISNFRRCGILFLLFWGRFFFALRISKVFFSLEDFFRIARKGQMDRGGGVFSTMNDFLLSKVVLSVSIWLYYLKSCTFL